MLRNMVISPTNATSNSSGNINNRTYERVPHVDSSPPTNSNAGEENAFSESPTLPSQEEEQRGDEEDNDNSNSNTQEEDDHNALPLRVLDLSGKAYNIKATLEWTVGQVKQKLSTEANVPVSLQRLIYRGQVLLDESLLTDCKLEAGHTIHLFARRAAESTNSENNTDSSNNNEGNNNNNTNDNGAATDQDSLPYGVYQVTDPVSAAVVFPTDGPRRIDPLMMDTSLGTSARRVKLWSMFLLIIYSMKVLSQFALMTRLDQRARRHSIYHHYYDDPSNNSTEPILMAQYPPSLNLDSSTLFASLLIHALGAYVGYLGFLAAHDTIIYQVRNFLKGLVLLANLTVLEQIYLTIKVSQLNYPEVADPIRHIPARSDIISANILQACVLVLMWLVAIYHATVHVKEVAAYNQTLSRNIVTPVLASDLESAQEDSNNNNNADQAVTQTEMV